MDYQVQILRANSKQLKNSNLYVLNIASKHLIASKYIRSREETRFDYDLYLTKLMQSEGFLTSIEHVEIINCLTDFIKEYEKFFIHLYERYTAKVVYYSPNINNHHTQTIIGFMFGDDKKRSLFAIKYGSLRANCIKVI